MSELTEPWEYDGRYYAVTKFSDVSTRDGYGWELADVSPAPGRGVLMEAFWDDTTTKLTFRSLTDLTLPLELVERFVREASQDVPPSP